MTEKIIIDFAVKHNSVFNEIVNRMRLNRNQEILNSLISKFAEIDITGFLNSVYLNIDNNTKKSELLHEVLHGALLTIPLSIKLIYKKFGGDIFDCDLFGEACKSGNLELVKWMCDEFPKKSFMYCKNEYSMSLALDNEKYDVARYLVSRGFKCEIDKYTQFMIDEDRKKRK